MSVSTLLTPARRDFLISALRYGVAGVFNTLVGFSIILALDLGLGLAPHLANAIGYAIGVCVSFVLSKVFVFKARQTALFLLSHFWVFAHTPNSGKDA